MGIVTARPDPAQASSPGLWAMTPSSGSTVANILEDDSDLTFISISQRSTLVQNVAKFFIVPLTNVDVPDGAKIKSVTPRWKILQVAPSGGSSFLSDRVLLTFEILEQLNETHTSGDLGDQIANFYRHAATFPNPTPPGGASPTWQMQSFTFTNTPAGAPFTIEFINAFHYSIQRKDNVTSLAKISEYYIDVEFNERPTVEILGPTETRVVTNGVTTNADATVTSATAAFTSNDVGASISGAGIPADTTILSINSATSVEMSANATATASGVTVTIVRAVITTTTRPIFTIAYDDAEGDLQAAVKFRVFTAAQVALGSFDVNVTTPIVASPGVGNWMVGQSSQWLSPVDLPNGDYVVFAQVKQEWEVPNQEHASTWDAYNFTVDVPGPPQPVLTAEPDNTQNWVQLYATASGADPATETYTFFYSDNAGISWRPVWGGWQVPSDVAGAATMFDYLAPLNQARWYKVLAYTTLGTIKVASDPSEIATATPTSREFWAKDPYAPTLNQAIGWMDDSPEQNRTQGVYTPLVAQGSKAYAIVVDGPLQGISGDSKLLFIDPDDAAWEKWKALRAAGHTLLLQYPTGEQHWVRLKGDAKWTWHTDATIDVSFRILEWGYIEVKTPLDPDAPVSAQQEQM